jgi:phosphoribosylglycinamide formyltransferase-1
MRVHEAVIDSGDKQSGITIHYVNEKYDKGLIIFQAKVAVDTTDTPESLASKIHELEYAHFPVVIEEVLGDRQ